MILNYSIDILYPRIQDSRTKEYFDEVLSCFYSGNYRSAVVMLYSVAICDLVFKLHQLKDIYTDKVATDILKRIETMQDNNPKSPDWETTLREELLKNRRLLTSSSYNHLESLRLERNLCAHPALKTSLELFRPNRVAVEAHIVNVLSEILTQPPFLEKELLSEILDDLDNQRTHLTKRDVIENYLKSSYLDRINSPELECRLFIRLWKIVFKLTNDKCNRNRRKNYLFLRLLLRRNTELIVAQIKKEFNKLSSQIDLSNLIALKMFIKIMNVYPQLYPLLEDSFKISFKAKINTNTPLKHMSFFLKEDFKKSYEELKSNISEDDDLPYLMAYTEQKISKEASMSLPIGIFSRSNSYAEARDNFDEFIEPNLDQFTLFNLQEVLEAIKNNSQIKGCFNVQDYYGRIKNTIIEKKPDFDFAPYPFIR